MTMAFAGARGGGRGEHPGPNPSGRGKVRMWGEGPGEGSAPVAEVVPGDQLVGLGVVLPHGHQRMRLAWAGTGRDRIQIPYARGPRVHWGGHILGYDRQALRGPGGRVVGRPGGSRGPPSRAPSSCVGGDVSGETAAECGERGEGVGRRGRGGGGFHCGETRP